MFPRNMISGGHLPAVTANAIAGNASLAQTATGSTAADALVLPADNVTIGTTAASTGVVLPVGEVGAEVCIDNQGASTLTIYPYQGNSNTINSTTSYSLATTKAVILKCTGINWIVIKGV